MSSYAKPSTWTESERTQSSPTRSVRHRRSLTKRSHGSQGAFSKALIGAGHLACLVSHSLLNLIGSVVAIVLAGFAIPLLIIGPIFVIAVCLQAVAWAFGGIGLV